jgi:hypothetical protein
MSASIAVEQTNLSSRLAMPHGLFGDLAVLAFLLAQVLDGALTYLGVHTWGIAVEANPLVSSAVSVVGVGAGLASAKLFAAGLGVMLHLRRAHAVVAALAALHFAVAVVPWALMFMTL